MDDLTVEREILLAIGDGSVGLLDALLFSPTRRRGSQAITDDFLDGMFCYFISNIMSPSLIPRYLERSPRF